MGKENRIDFVGSIHMFVDHLLGFTGFGRTQLNG